MRVLAFLYFTCADADADADIPSGDLALRELLKRESGLPPDRAAALAHEAHGWLRDLPDLDARLALLTERVPQALAHLPPIEREELLNNLLELARADRGVTATEQRVRDALRGLLA